MSSKIYQLNVSDKVLILDTRTAFIYPFSAPNWTDLRLGMFLSVTKTASDDDQSALGEDLIFVDKNDAAYIGFKNNSNDTIPKTAGVVFAGITSLGAGFPTDDSRLLPSDTNLNDRTHDFGGVGTKFWKLQNTDAPRTAFIDGTSPTWESNDLGYLAFPQSSADAGGYSVFLAIALKRSTGSSTTLQISADGAYLGWMNTTFSNAPTTDLIRTLLRGGAFSYGSATSLSAVPDALYFYWPFNNSRLRIHSLVLEKFA